MEVVALEFWLYTGLPLEISGYAPRERHSASVGARGREVWPSADENHFEFVICVLTLAMTTLSLMARICQYDNAVNIATQHEISHSQPLSRLNSWSQVRSFLQVDRDTNLLSSTDRGSGFPAVTRHAGMR